MLLLARVYIDIVFMLTIRCCREYNKCIYKLIRKLLISDYKHRPYNTIYNTSLTNHYTSTTIAMKITRKGDMQQLITMKKDVKQTNIMKEITKEITVTIKENLKEMKIINRK